MKKNKRIKYKRQKVPAATVALYIGMVVVILGICTAVFFISFNILNEDNNSSPTVNNSHSSSSGFILPDDESSSSVDQSSSFAEQSSESPDDSNSSEENSSSNSSSSSSSHGSSSSDSPNSSDSPDSSGSTQPMSFSKEFFKDDLFIGDSIFTGLYLYNYLDMENVAAKVGYTPYGALNSAFDDKGITALDYAKQRSPKRVFILLGSNALNSSEMSALKNSYSNLLTTFKSEFPSATICCISITPVARETSYPNVKNADVAAMNDYIQKQCKALGLDYYDFYSVISDEDGYFLTEYAENDGMHFKGSTYKVLLSALQKKYS